jgi:hypothetical protein
MSTYLCPSCQGRGSVGVIATFGFPHATSTTTCLSCGGTGAIGAPTREIIGFRCVFCGTAHAPRGDCHYGADVACCGEVGKVEPIYRADDQ